MNNFIRNALAQISSKSDPDTIFSIILSISDNQRPFDWMGWTFGKRILEEPQLVYQVSESNLIKILIMMVRLERFSDGSFRSFHSIGLVGDVIDRLKLFIEGKVTSEKKIVIDPVFDPRADSNLNNDPDTHSETLRKYHRLLWSKELPNGKVLELSDKKDGKYLYHSSDLGEFNFKSDSIDGSFYFVKKMDQIHIQLKNGEKDKIFDRFHIPGSYSIFPGDKVEGVMTINQARGCNLKIVDRLDLTLECIRRHYLGIDNPLASTLRAYSKFFDMFDSFEGFVEFFLMQDMYDFSNKRIKFLLDFDDSFPNKPYPKNLDEYYRYIDASFSFCESRTKRMVEYSNHLNNLPL